MLQLYVVYKSATNQAATVSYRSFVRPPNWNDIKFRDHSFTAEEFSHVIDSSSASANVSGTWTVDFAFLAFNEQVDDTAPISVGVLVDKADRSDMRQIFAPGGDMADKSSGCFNFYAYESNPDTDLQLKAIAVREVSDGDCRWSELAICCTDAEASFFVVDIFSKDEAERIFIGSQGDNEFDDIEVDGFDESRKEFIETNILYINRQEDRDQILQNVSNASQALVDSNLTPVKGWLWKAAIYIFSLVTYDAISRDAEGTVVKMPRGGEEKAKWKKYFGEYRHRATIDVQNYTSGNKLINVQFQIGRQPGRYTYSCVLVPRYEESISNDSLRKAFLFSAALQRKVEIEKVVNTNQWGLKLI